MPRLPTILSDVGVAAPSGPRYPYRQDSVAPAILAAGAHLSDTFIKFAEIKQKQRVAAAGVEVDTAIDQLKNDYDAETTRLREAGQPEKYEEQANQAFTTLAQRAAQRLAYDESSGLFQHKLSKLQSENAIKARADGLRLEHAQTNARAVLLDRSDANAVVFGATPQEREDALARLAERDKRLVATGARATSALPAAYADIDEAMARRDFDTPAQRSQVIADLTAGRYQYLPPDKQLTLRDTLVNKAVQDRDRERTEQTNLKRDLADEAERGIVDTVRNKDYGQAQDLLHRYGQYMSGEEKRGWQEYITKAQTTVQSDPGTRTTLSVMTYTADTAQTINSARAAVIRAVGTGKLDAADGDKFLGHLQSAAKADQNRREDKALDAYHRIRSAVHEELKEDLRVTGPLQGLVPSAQNAYSMALDDMNRNVPVESATGEDPREWYKRTKAQWVARVAMAATTKVAELERGLEKYTQNPGALDTEVDRLVARGQRLPLELKNTIRRLKDAEAIRREVQYLKGTPEITEYPKAEGGKSESGGKSGDKSFGYK